MPIYEYHCNACNKDFEFFQMKKNELPVCPNCRNNNVQKLASRFGLSGGSKDDISSQSSTSSACATCHSGSCSTCR